MLTRFLGYIDVVKRSHGHLVGHVDGAGIAGPHHVLCLKQNVISGSETSLWACLSVGRSVSFTSMFLSEHLLSLVSAHL